MSGKDELRIQRKNTVINTTSKRQEKALMKAMNRVSESLQTTFPNITLKHQKQWPLKGIVENLSKSFPDVDFHYYFESSFMKPDGGILHISSRDKTLYPILISEKKNQGTNDLRKLEGKARQARGNAIERLGKNVIGFRAALKVESIFPFVCFGDGCDFEDGSSILDRVVTIAQFGQLNKVHLHKEAEGAFDRGTFFFRDEEWTEEEMFCICKKIAESSIYYYFSKYGKDSFV